MEKDYMHKIYPKQFERNEFWAQIKRTVNGVPVSEEDIDTIIAQISSQLDLQRSDHLLDLGCANAALASRLFDSISAYTGVDFSEYLIDIANEYFRPNESIRYIESDIQTYILGEQRPEIYSKALCYGTMAYLPKDDLIDVVRLLKERFENVERIFFGNIPDKAKAKDFFSKRNVYDYSLDDAQSPIGVWWYAKEISSLVEDVGYTAIISHMPESFYGSSYRFDLTLVNKAY